MWHYTRGGTISEVSRLGNFKAWGLQLPEILTQPCPLESPELYGRVPQSPVCSLLGTRSYKQQVSECTSVQSCICARGMPACKSIPSPPSKIGDCCCIVNYSTLHNQQLGSQFPVTSRVKERNQFLKQGSIIFHSPKNVIANFVQAKTCFTHCFLSKDVAKGGRKKC